MLSHGHLLLADICSTVPSIQVVARQKLKEAKETITAGWHLTETNSCDHASGEKCGRHVCLMVIKPTTLLPMVTWHPQQSTTLSLHLHPSDHHPSPHLFFIPHSITIFSTNPFHHIKLLPYQTTSQGLSHLVSNFHCSLVFMFLVPVTRRRSVAKSVGCFQRRLSVCLFVNTITSKRVNTGWWNLGVSTQILAEFEFGGQPPGCAPPKMWCSAMTGKSAQAV